MVQSAPQAAPGYDNRYDETGAQYGQSPPSHNPPPIEVVGNAAYGYPPAPPPGYTAQPPSSNPPPTNAAYGYPPPPPPPGYAAPPPGYTAPLDSTIVINNTTIVEPGCECGIGWILFGIGWIIGISWIIGAILFCLPHKSTDRPGLIGCLVMSIISGVFTIIIIVSTAAASSAVSSPNNY